MNFHVLKKTALAAPLAIGLFLSWGCSKDSSSGSPSSASSVETKSAESGVRILITDAPFPLGLVKSAEVTISEVSMRNKDSGGFVVVMSTPRKVDLIHLRNGLTETLVDSKIPAGSYDQVRIVIDESSLTLADGREFPMKVPSGQESGLKINVTPAIEVSTQVSSDLLIDFDLSRSFSIIGNKRNLEEIRGFMMHPVLRACNLTKAGTVAGIVTGDGKALSGATVSVTPENSTEVYATALTNADGTFKMVGVPPGKYNVTAEMTGYTMSTPAPVTVVEGNMSEVRTDLQLAPVEQPTPPAPAQNPAPAPAPAPTPANPNF